MNYMRSDDICENFAKRNGKLTVRLLDNETVLLEGTVEGLTFLSELLLAHSEEKEDGQYLGPNGSGQALFSDKSTLGLYIHRIPCEEKNPT